MVKSLNAAFTRLFDRPDAGKLALRLTFGGLMLFHGVAKIQHGVGWIAGALQEQGLPPLSPMACMWARSWRRY